jgi:hypothetical protein
MSELPGRPNIDQLRHQARELLRAATGGEPAALARIRAFSDRVSLSAAQLAMAREYGFASWPALHAEVERRLAALRSPGEGAGTHWSFGGASPLETAVGTLYPGGLLAGPGHAVLHASLMPSAQIQDQLAVVAPMSSSARHAHANALMALREAIIPAVSLTDDQATTYILHVNDIQHYPDLSRDRGPVQLGVEPVPARERGWLELRGQDGSAARLVPSVRPSQRVSRVAPAPGSPAVEELTQRALGLITLQLLEAGQDKLQRACSDALARAAEIQQSGGPGAAGDLPDQLAKLCAALTGHGPADGLPAAWSSVIGAVDRTDGASQHLDVSVDLARSGDTVVRVDSLVSEPEIWRLYLRAEPSWWTYSADRQRKWPVMSVSAEDDLGGVYLNLFDGSRRRGDLEELTLRFLPRLNPLARVLTLTFSGAGEQQNLELQLP